MTLGASTAGYRRLNVGNCTVVTRDDLTDDALAMLREGTLYESASRMPDRRELLGRGISYAVSLPVSRTRVVVRHNRHGGLFAPITRDWFVAPTRAPHELLTARQLRAAAVRTPDVMMFGVSPALGRLQRADVVTAEIVNGRDLAAYLLPGETKDSRAEAWEATREVLRSLNAAGARHHDLNAKNILIASEGGTLRAWVLDVDRVVFSAPNAPEVRRGNVARLLRSLRKWRDERGAEVDESELAALGRLV